MSENGALRTTQFNSKECYEISGINFYLPLKLADQHQVFIVMKNSNNLYEIIELSKFNLSQNGSNILYKVPLNQKMRINQDKVDLNLMLINNRTGEYVYSVPVSIMISTNDYSLARQVYVAQQVNQQVSELYLKVLEMTKENEKMYKEIQKGDKRG